MNNVSGSTGTDIEVALPLSSLFISSHRRMRRAFTRVTTFSLTMAEEISGIAGEKCMQSKSYLNM